MTSRIPDELRRTVIQRASGCCEYCLLHQEDHFLSFEIDHIIAEKHRGATATTNLCLSCPDCNGSKGSDICSLDPQDDVLTRLFNPRQDVWAQHFRFNGEYIEPITAIGRVTEFTLKLNNDERIRQRQVLVRSGRYPCTPQTP